MTTKINMEVLKSRIQGYLKDDAISLHSPSSCTHHIIYKLDSSSHGDLLLRVGWAAVWDDENRQSKEVSDFKMRSEVATMHYVKEHTSIPVPDILVYDSDWDRKVGEPWMLMKYIDGVCPTSLNDDQWETLCTSVADIWSQLLRLRFKSIGSIYEQRYESESRYFIGPMTYIPHSGSLASPEASTSRPFSSARQWLVASAKGKLHPTQSIQPDFDHEAAQKRREIMIGVVQKSPLLDSESLDHEQIVLAHMDFSLHNILVDRNDPTRVVAVVDWEGCAYPSHLMRDRILRQIPGWEFATGDSCNDLRWLQWQADLSAEDPSLYDKAKPLLHRMSWLDARYFVKR
ncbi:hypothetical protein F5146DRAFT_1164633 [Armillaria mellea]|nr:hypothetical protein F5146DRAFT_1164633 [Armillaria mellea]